MSVPSPRITVVLPCHNEQENLRPLISRIAAALATTGDTYEIVVTDDRSTDNSWNLLQELAAADPRIRVQRFVRNAGQSAAVWAGIQSARGDIIITLDADLQNDPADIPKLLAALKDADCATGSRVAARAQGDNVIRQISSRIANHVRNQLTGEEIGDAACGFRAFKRECAQRLKFFKGMHRFLATLFRMEGFKVVEVPISHHPRHGGKSHYGVLNRMFSASYDLFAVRWMKKRMFRYEVEECHPPELRNPHLHWVWRSPQDPPH